MLNDEVGQDLVQDINKTESDILMIANKKIRLWNLLYTVKKIKNLIVGFFSLVINNFKDIQLLQKTNNDIFKMFKIQQQQIDIMNKEITKEK